VIFVHAPIIYTKTRYQRDINQLQTYLKLNVIRHSR